MEKNVFLEVANYLKQEYNELFIDNRNKFVGCKFGKSDRFYIFYLSFLYGKFTLTYRKNVNEDRVIREKLDEMDISNIFLRVTSILNDNIINRPQKILSKNTKRSNSKKLKKYKDFILLYKNIKLYELNVQPYVYNYLVSKGLVTIVDFLLYDFDFYDEDKLLIKKINYLKSFLLLPSLQKIKNYKFLLKSSFKDNFKNDDYERYIDFSLSIGNLTYNLVSKFFGERNSLLFFDYMNLSSKNNYTFRDLGEKYNVSFGRVRDIVNNIIKKLKLFKGEYVLIIDTIEEEDVLNYFIIGIIFVYNRNFLKMVLDILELDVYDSIYFRTKYFIEDVKNKRNKFSVSVNESKMFNLIKFSLNVRKSNTLIFRSLYKMRSVDNFHNNTGKIKLKKTNGYIEYESLTEKRVLEMLEACSFVKYIKTQSLVIPFQNFRENFEYYPDIQILTNDKKLVIIEIKPLIYMMERASIFKYNLLKEYAFKNNYAYAFIDDRYNSFDDVMNREIPIELENVFLTFVKERKYILYEDFKNFKKEYNCKLIDVVSIVIKNNKIIEFTNKPFKFRYRGKN